MTAAVLGDEAVVGVNRRLDTELDTELDTGLDTGVGCTYTELVRATTLDSVEGV